MVNFNKVIIAGNITADPELKYLQNGTPVCSMQLAINEHYKDKDGEKKENVTFVPITVWKKQAENCAEYLKKGSPVLVEGKLKLDQWVKDGQKRSKLEVVAISVQFLSRPTGDGKPVNNQPSPENEPSPEQNGDEGEGDIPF